MLLLEYMIKILFTYWSVCKNNGDIIKCICYINHIDFSYQQNKEVIRREGDKKRWERKNDKKTTSLLLTSTYENHRKPTSNSRIISQTQTTRRKKISKVLKCEVKPYWQMPRESGRNNVMTSQVIPRVKDVPTRDDGLTHPIHAGLSSPSPSPLAHWKGVLTWNWISVLKFPTVVHQKERCH